MSELKPCPFCGGEPKLCGPFNHWFWVQCSSCYVRTPDCNSERQSRRSWNKRAATQEQDYKDDKTYLYVRVAHNSALIDHETMRSGLGALFWANVPPDTPLYTITGLAPGVQYTLYIYKPIIEKIHQNSFVPGDSGSVEVNIPDVSVRVL